MAAVAGKDGDGSARQADLQDRIRVAEERVTAINDELVVLNRSDVDEGQIADA